jgi:hypothetical protein
MFAKQLYLGIALVTIAAAAHAKVENPLQPSYYWGRYSAETVPTNGGKPYVDNRNPRHPAYAHVTVDWQPVVASGGIAYRDSGNPLHPSFKR